MEISEQEFQAATLRGEELLVSGCEVEVLLAVRADKNTVARFR